MDSTYSDSAPKQEMIMIWSVSPDRQATRPMIIFASKAFTGVLYRALTLPNSRGICLARPNSSVARLAARMMPWKEAISPLSPIEIKRGYRSPPAPVTFDNASGSGESEVPAPGDGYTMASHPATPMEDRN